MLSDLLHADLAIGIAIVVGLSLASGYAALLVGVALIPVVERITRRRDGR